MCPLEERLGTGNDEEIDDNRIDLLMPYRCIRRHLLWPTRARGDLRVRRQSVHRPPCCGGGRIRNRVRQNHQDAELVDALGLAVIASIVTGAASMTAGMAIAFNQWGSSNPTSHICHVRFADHAAQTNMASVHAAFEPLCRKDEPAQRWKMVLAQALMFGMLTVICWSTAAFSPAAEPAARPDGDPKPVIDQTAENGVAFRVLHVKRDPARRLLVIAIYTDNIDRAGR